MTELTVVQFSGENRIDSRLVAKSLGIKHKAFSETIGKYLEELEELGKVPFQTEASGKTNQPQKYAMLNEDQAIFASTLSRNTRKVVVFKLALTKAFAQARKKGQEQHSYINANFVQRLKLNRERTLPEHWTVLEQLDKEAWHFRLDMTQLIHTAKPDVSVGLKWSNYLKKNGYDTSKFMKVPNIVHPPTMREEDVKAYPLEMLPMFLLWFRSEYREHLTKYYLPPRELGKKLA